MKKSEINFKVQLDENNIPETIHWEATDSGELGLKECKSLMISMWDKNESNTLRIDLWTKEMLVDEMKRFYHQILLSMADNFEKATGEDKMAGDMRDFSEYFAEKMDIIKPTKK
jgi:gliding motility-associated protein GldC